MAPVSSRRRTTIPCFYCGVNQTQHYRHMERKHKEELEVAEIMRQSEHLEGKAREKYRRNAYLLLSRAGQGRRNQETRQRGGSRRSLILVRAIPGQNPPPPSLRYIECPDCLATFADIRRHKVCRPRTTPVGNESIRERGRIHTTMVTLRTDNRELAKLYSTMKQDEVLDIASHDELIKHYAAFGVLKIVDFGSDAESDEEEEDPLAVTKHPVGKRKTENKKDTLRAAIRLLGRFVKACREKKPGVSMLDMFTNAHVAYMHRAIRKITQSYRLTAQGKKLIALIRNVYAFARARFETPEFPLVRKAAVGQEIEIANSFLGTSGVVRDGETPMSLPTRADLQTFREALDRQLDEYELKPKSSFTYGDYLDYCRHLICRLAMYNLRRASEVAAMSHTQYRNREPPSEEAFSDRMSVEEVERAKLLRVVTVAGKSFHHQSAIVVLNPKWNTAIKRIRTIGKRVLGAENAANPYVFGTRGRKGMWLRGSKAFEVLRKKYGVDNVTAGKIRKHAGTQATLEGDIRRKKLLSSILAHDLSTHSLVYEEHMATSVAKFWHVPSMLDYVEQGRGDLRNVTLTLPEVEEDDDAEAETEPLVIPEDYSSEDCLSEDDEPHERPPQVGARPAKKATGGKRRVPAATAGRKHKVAGQESSRGEPWNERMIAVLKTDMRRSFQPDGVVTMTACRRVHSKLVEMGYSVTLSSVRARAQRLKRAMAKSASAREE